MDDDFATDADFAALAVAAERSSSSNNQSGPPRQPVPRVRAPGAAAAAAGSNPESGSKVIQPTPRALAQRTGPSAIIVSTRQRGNPLLTHISALPWEYGDIVPDYIVGATACSLFLSLKYHRLHPEYIYSRIRALGHKYNLRVLLVIVDIDNHEEPLRELAKTSLVNDLTLIVSWSAREAARYLESYKALEHAAPAAIRGTKAQGYAEQMVDFVTVPRGINRTDAMGMIGTFGSIRAAIGAPLADLRELQGWGDIKADRWHRVVREPFRRDAARSRLAVKNADKDTFQSAARAVPAERERLRAATGISGRPESRGGEDDDGRASNGATTRTIADQYEPAPDEEEALLFLSQDDMAAPATTTMSAESTAIAATTDAPSSNKRAKPAQADAELDAGIAAALAKYRKQ